MSKFQEILARINTKVDSKLILSIVNTVMGILRQLMQAKNNGALEEV